VYDHDQPACLKERLLAHGFTAEEREALAVLDLRALPPSLQASAPPYIVRLTQPEQIDQLMDMESQVWGEPFDHLGRRLKRDLQQPRRLTVFGAVLDGRVVSGAWIYYHKDKPFADLYGGSTLPAYRQRGLYTALVAARAQEAITRGVRFVIVDASPMSRPILEKLGFEVLLYSQPFVK
jgi:predicted GNAT family acetyltransferase